MVGEECHNHIEIVERLVKNETTLEFLEKQGATIFHKIDLLHEKMDTVISGRISKGVFIALIVLSNLVVGLIVYLVSKV